MATAGLLAAADLVRSGGRPWVSAGMVPGLAFPQAIPADPVAEPLAAGGSEAAEWARLVAIAKGQRRLNLLVVAFLGLGPMLGWFFPQDVSAILIVLHVVMTASVVGLMAALARALGLPAWSWGLSGMVPLLNLLAILSLSARATAALRAAGIRVGFLGTALPAVMPESFTANRRLALEEGVVSSAAPGSLPPPLVRGTRRAVRWFLSTLALAMVLWVLQISALETAGPPWPRLTGMAWTLILYSFIGSVMTLVVLISLRTLRAITRAVGG